MRSCLDTATKRPPLSLLIKGMNSANWAVPGRRTLSSSIIIGKGTARPYRHGGLGCFERWGNAASLLEEKQ